DPTEIPLKTGAKVTANRWIIELVELKETQVNRLGRATVLDLVIDKAEKDAPDLPPDVRTLVHLQDADGKELTGGDDLFNDPTPRPTGGGLRQRLWYWHVTRAGAEANPAKLL